MSLFAIVWKCKAAAGRGSCLKLSRGVEFVEHLGYTHNQFFVIFLSLTIRRLKNI